MRDFYPEQVIFISATIKTPESVGSLIFDKVHSNKPKHF